MQRLDSTLWYRLLRSRWLGVVSENECCRTPTLRFASLKKENDVYADKTGSSSPVLRVCQPILIKVNHVAIIHFRSDTA